MDPATLLDVLLFFTFLSVSAILAAGEAAFFRVRLRSLEGAGDGRSATLVRMLGKPHELLIKLLLGTSLCNVLVVLLALRITWRAFPEAGRTPASAVSVLLATLLIAIFARLLPKIYAGRSPEAAALALARPASVLLLPAYPLVKAVLVFTEGLFDSRIYQVVSDDCVSVDGGARIADLNKALRTCISNGHDCVTMAGLVCSLASGMPSEGDRLDAGGLRLVVCNVHRGRVERVLVARDGIGKEAAEMEE